jgi:aminopeptidase N
MNRPVNEYMSEYEYQCMTYVKGELMLDALRDSIGGEKFMKGIQRYYEDNKFAHATPEAFIYSMEKGSGAKVSGFVNSWIEGKVVI